MNCYLPIDGKSITDWWLLLPPLHATLFSCISLHQPAAAIDPRFAKNPSPIFLFWFLPAEFCPRVGFSLIASITRDSVRFSFFTFSGSLGSLFSLSLSFSAFLNCIFSFGCLLHCRLMDGAGALSVCVCPVNASCGGGGAQFWCTFLLCCFVCLDTHKQISSDAAS